MGHSLQRGNYPLLRGKTNASMKIDVRLYKDKCNTLAATIAVINFISYQEQQHILHLSLPKKKETKIEIPLKMIKRTIQKKKRLQLQ